MRGHDDAPRQYRDKEPGPAARRQQPDTADEDAERGPHGTVTLTSSGLRLHARYARRQVGGEEGGGERRARSLGARQGSTARRPRPRGLAPAAKGAARCDGTCALHDPRRRRHHAGLRLHVPRPQARPADAVVTASRTATGSSTRPPPTTTSARWEKACAQRRRPQRALRHDEAIDDRLRPRPRPARLRRQYRAAWPRLPGPVFCAGPCPATSPPPGLVPGRGGLFAEGRVRAIGVCDRSPRHLAALIERTGVVPAVNQVELAPYFIQGDARGRRRPRRRVAVVVAHRQRAQRDRGAGPARRPPARRPAAHRSGGQVRQRRRRWCSLAHDTPSAPSPNRSRRHHHENMTSSASPSRPRTSPPSTDSTPAGAGAPTPRRWTPAPSTCGSRPSTHETRDEEAAMKGAMIYGPRDVRFEERADAHHHQAHRRRHQDRGDLRVRLRPVALPRPQPHHRADHHGPRVLRHRGAGRQRRHPGAARAVRHRLVLRLRQHLRHLPRRLPDRPVCTGSS